MPARVSHLVFMNGRFLFSLSAVILLAACRKPTPPEEPDAPATRVEVATPAPVVATPMPATPVPVVHRLAPEGIFYVLQRVTVTTDDGIHGLAPGTGVRLVRKTDAGMVVTDGQHEFTALPSQLTNDLDVAGNAAGIDARQRANLAAAQQAQVAAIAQQQKAALAPASSGGAGGYSPIQAKIDGLLRQEATLTAEISRLNASEAATAEASGRVGSLKSTTAVERSGLTERLVAVRKQLFEARAEAERLKR